jgi:hypothetical protein
MPTKYRMIQLEGRETDNFKMKKSISKTGKKLPLKLKLNLSCFQTEPSFAKSNPLLAYVLKSIIIFRHLDSVTS